MSIFNKDKDTTATEADAKRAVPEQTPSTPQPARGKDEAGEANEVVEDQPPEPAPGRRYAGEPFPTTVSVEEIVANDALQAPKDDANAMTLDAWFAARGHRDQVKRDMMKAYTKVRRATAEQFDEIFKTF